MNKIVRFLSKIPDAFLTRRRLGPSISRVSVYSYQTQSGSSDALYRRLQRCNEQGVSLIPVLDELVVEGRVVHYEQLKRYIREFRKNRRFNSALEIATWMNHSMKPFTINPGHVAVQLDLISKVHGLEEAENYFNSLDDGLKDRRVYGALLNCYADAKSLEKAEATMEKIRKTNDSSSLVYNTMLSLYSQMGMHEKLDSLVQEMEDKGIDFSIFTYNIRLNVYAEYDLQAMERLLMKMEVDPTVTIDYCSYTTAAKGYIRAGALEKASVALKKAEHLVRGPKGNYIYGILISLYAAMQKRKDVFRLWNLLSKGGNVHYHCYAYMIASLEKLDDLDSAKKIMEEWEEKRTKFDIRIPNLLISAYCKRGLVGEAEIFLKRLVETGKDPSAKTWSHMALGYCKNGRMEEAVETIKKAFTASFPGWKPDLTTMAACIEYLKEKGDNDAIQEMLMLLEKRGSLSADFKERIGTCLSNAELRPEAVESKN